MSRSGHQATKRRTGPRASVVESGIKAARKRSDSRGKDKKPTVLDNSEALSSEEIVRQEARRTSVQHAASIGQLNALAIMEAARANTEKGIELARWNSTRAKSPSKTSERDIPGSQNSLIRGSQIIITETKRRASQASLIIFDDLSEVSAPSSAGKKRPKYKDKNDFLTKEINPAKRFAFRLALFNNGLASGGTAATKFLSVYSGLLSISLCFANSAENSSSTLIVILSAIGFFSVLASVITYKQRRPYLTLPANENTYKQYEIRPPALIQEEWNGCTKKVFFAQTILGAFFAGLPYASGIQILVEKNLGGCSTLSTITCMALAFLPFAAKNFLAESTKQRQLYKGDVIGKTSPYSSLWNYIKYYFFYATASLYPYCNSAIGSYGIYTLIPDLIKNITEASGGTLNPTALIFTKTVSSVLAYISFIIVSDAYFYFDGKIMFKRVSEFKPETSSENKSAPPKAYFTNYFYLVIGYPARWLIRKYTMRDVTIKFASAFLVAAIAAQFGSSDIAALMRLHLNLALELVLTSFGLWFGAMMGGGTSRSKLPEVPAFEAFKIPTAKAWFWFTCRRYIEAPAPGLTRSSSNLSDIFKNAVLNPLRKRRVAEIQKARSIQRSPSASSNDSSRAENASPQHERVFSSTRSFQRPSTPVQPQRIWRAISATDLAADKSGSPVPEGNQSSTSIEVKVV